MFKLIESYINVLTLDQVDIFLKSNSIIIDYETLLFIYQNIKTNYKDIIDNPDEYLNTLKDKLSINNYNKIYELYIKYKNYL